VRLAELLIALLHHAQARDGELQLDLELGLDGVATEPLLAGVAIASLLDGKDCGVFGGAMI
jgi:hypothetical protein